jgi:hypothetical protein
MNHLFFAVIGDEKSNGGYRLAMYAFAASVGLHVAIETLLVAIGVRDSTKSRDGKPLTPLTTFVTYQIISFCWQVFLSLYGWYGVLVPDSSTTSLVPTYAANNTFVDDPLGWHPIGFLVGEAHTGYQMYNLLICLFIVEYRTPVYLMHHIMAGTLASFAPLGVLHRHLIVFMGAMETSTCVLSFVDTDKYYPGVIPARFVEACKAAFFFMFFAVRVVWWSFAFREFWADCFAILGVIDRYDATAYHIYVFMGGNMLLTLLQAYWAVLLVLKARRMVNRALAGKKTGGVPGYGVDVPTPRTPIAPAANGGDPKEGNGNRGAAGACAPKPQINRNLETLRKR